MMKLTLRYMASICLVACMYNATHAMNIVRPFKFFFNPAPHYGTRWQLFALPETGFDSSGFNGCSKSVKVPRLYHHTENSLAMLDGFPADSIMGKKRIELDADDDGIRGHLSVCADFRVDFGCTLAVRRTLPYNILLGIYLPFFTMKLNHIRWHDKTKNVKDKGVTAEDLRVRNNLTNGIVHNNGCIKINDLQQTNTTGQAGAESICLDVRSWRRTGLGDMAIVADWLQDFVQAKPVLRNVRLNARLGLTLPTGLKDDINKFLAFPFGYNGTASVIFGGGLNCTFGYYTHIGFDVELRSLFGNTTCKRIKVDRHQTESLLLQKARVYNDYALEQQYTIFGELHDLIPHTSCKLAYQFFKRGDSSISLYGNCFSDVIANSSRDILERNWHEILVVATHDFGYLTRDHSCATPTLSLYGEFPYRGKRVITCFGLGAIINVDF